jgi:uncharacterized repeat protein (TIGR04138 family)
MIHPLQQVLEQDPRYPVQAYQFVRDALSYAHDVMGLGRDEAGASEELERHLTGQQLSIT